MGGATPLTRQPPLEVKERFEMVYVLVGVTSLFPITVLAALVLTARDALYRSARSSMRADGRSPWGW